MRFKKIMVTSLLSIMFLVCGMFLTACGGPKAVRIEVISGIQQEVTQNYVMNYSDVSAKVYFDNDTEKVITINDLEFSTIDTSTVGSKTLTITYKANKEIKVEIIINVTSSTAITGIAVTGYTGVYDGIIHDAVSVNGALTGDTITYSDNNQTFSATMPKVINAGSKTIYIKVTRPFFNDFTTSIQTNIEKATLSITADNKEVTYGQTAPSYTVSYDGFVNNETTAVLTTQPTITCDYTTTANVGTKAIVVSGAVATNYSFEYTNGTLTINKASYDMANVSWVYNTAFTYNGTERTVTLTQLPTGVTANYIDNKKTNAGEYTASATFNYDTTNYNAPTINNLSWTINKVAVQVTADNQTVTYGQTAPNYTVSYDGFINNDTSTVLTTQPTITCDYTTTTNVGTKAIVVSGAVATNYSFEYTNGTLTINKASYDMANVGWNYTTPFTYNGEAQEVLVTGLPTGVTVNQYTNNSKTDAGTYIASVTFNYDTTNYKTPTINSQSWVINKASYDMANVNWNYTEPFTYNGSEQTVALTQLPTGVTANYTDNKKTNAGSYTASVAFNYDTTNYNAPTLANMSCDWVINKAVVQVIADNKEVTYGHNAPTYTISYNGFVNDETSAVLTTQPTIACDYTEATNAGTTAIVVSGAVSTNYSFEYTNGTLTINKADYNMANAVWDYTTPFTYSAQTQTVSVIGLPTGVTVNEYTDNAKINAGSYTASVTFNYDATNFNAPTIGNKTWVIKKADYNMSNAGWDYTTPFTYSAQTQTVVVTGLPTGVTVNEYTDNAKINAGSYTASVTFNYDATNYNAPIIDNQTWVINKADYNMTTARWDYTVPFTYSAQTQTVSVIDLPTGVTVKEYTNNAKIDAGSYVAHAELDYDTANYNAVSITDLNWTINAKSITGITLTAYNAEYDGAFHSFTFNNGQYNEQDSTFTKDNTIFDVTFSTDNGVTYNSTLPKHKDVTENAVIIKVKFTKTNYITLELTTSITINIANDMGISTNNVVGDFKDDAYFPSLNGTQAGDIITYSTNNGVTFTSEVVSLKNVGTISYKVKVQRENYADAIVSGTITVNQKAIEKPTQLATTFTYSGQVQEYIPVGFDANTMTIANNQQTNWTANGYSVTVTPKSNYKWDTIGDATFNFMIEKLSITKPTVNVAVFEYNGANQTYLPNGFNSENMTITNNVQKDWVEGGYTVTVAPKSNFKWSDGINPTFNFVINKRVINVTTNNKTITYNDAAPTYDINYSDNFINNEDSTIFTTQATATCSYVKGDDAGTYDIVLSGATANNYSFNYTDGELTVEKYEITVYAGNKTVTYGYPIPQDFFDAIIHTESFVNGDDYSSITTMPIATCDYTTTANVGTKIIVVSGGSATNYKFNYEDGLLTITPAKLSITANNITVTYGDAVPTYTVSYNGFKNNDSKLSLTGELDILCYYTPLTNVGQLAIMPSGLTSNNYDIEYADGKITINPATVTVIADNKEVTYGHNAPTYTVSYSGFVNNQTSAILTTQPTINCDYTTLTNVGTKSIIASGAVASNYTFEYTNGILTIIKADYDMSNVSWDYTTPFTYNGEEKEIFVTNLPTGVVVNQYTNNSKIDVGTYIASVTFNYDTTNYNAPSIDNQTWAIEKANYDMSNVVWNYTTPFTFDGNEKIVKLSNLPNGVTANYTDNKKTDAGNYTASVVFNYDTTNYNAPVFANMSCDWVINKAVVQVTADNKEVTYGHTAPTYTVSYNGFINNDSSAVLTTQPIIICDYTEATNVGTKAIIVSGAVATNYTFEYTNGTLTIIKADYDMANVGWDYTTPFTYSAQTQTVSVTNLPMGVTVNQYTDNAKINAGSYTASVTFNYDTTNYNAPTLANCVWEILQQAISKPTNPEGGVPTYNGTQQTFTPNGFNDSIMNINNNVQTNAGDYLAIVTLKDTTNYKWDTNGNCEIDFSINPILAEIDWGTSVFEFDGTEKVPTAEVANLYGDDTCVVIVDGATSEGGIHTATVIGLSNNNYALPTNNTTTFEIIYEVYSFESNLLKNYNSNKGTQIHEYEQFAVMDKELKVGDDNEFSLQIVGTYLDTEGNLIDTDEVSTNLTILIYNENTSEYEEIGNNIYYEVINGNIKFTSEAVDCRFQITAVPKLYNADYLDSPSVVVNVKVIDGYNVYTAKDIALFGNLTNNGWSEYKTTENISTEQPSALIFQKNIIIQDNDIPSNYFYSQEEANSFSSGITNGTIAGSFRDYDGYAVYQRNMVEGKDFAVYGNYFQLDYSQITRAVIETGGKDGVVINDDNPSQEKLITMHTPLFKVYGKGSDTNFVMSDLNIKGNAQRSARSVHSGGLLFIKICETSSTVNNCIQNDAFIGFMYEDNRTGGPDSRTAVNTMINTKAYNAFNCLLYVYGVKDLLVENCDFVGAGGPVMIADEVQVKEKDNTYTYYDSHILVINSNFESYVSGNEPWFVSYGASPLVPQIKQANAPYAGYTNSTFLKTYSGINECMNLKVVFKSNTAEGLTGCKVHGTVSFFDNRTEYESQIATPSTPVVHIFNIGDSQLGQNLFINSRNGGVFNAGDVSTFTPDDGVVAAGTTDLNVYLANGMGIILELTSLT